MKQLTHFNSSRPGKGFGRVDINDQVISIRLKPAARALTSILGYGAVKCSLLFDRKY